MKCSKIKKELECEPNAFENLNMKPVFYGVSFILLLSGCSTFYYGYARAEWLALSPEQQVAAKAEYENVIKQKAEWATGEEGQKFIDRNVTVNQAKFPRTEPRDL